MRGGSHAGRLLVATPAIGDTNFSRTVILVIEHSAEGAFGLVLNRPTELDVREPLPEWLDCAAPPQVVFVGGPVEQDRAIALARADRSRPATGWHQILGPIGTLDLSRGPELVGPGLEAIRVFAGYAGWDAEQLEDEVAAGDWFVVEGRPEDALCDAPEDLWADVLRRQGGSLARFARYPLDPSMN